MRNCKKADPSERIRIFISSAQNDENGFNWGELRHRIKNTLNQCKYMYTIILEDEVSIIPSTQFFQEEVEKADVVVTLVKGEIRKGTQLECSLRIEKKKPLLVYFLDDDNPNKEVKEFEEYLQKNDYNTYRHVSSKENLDIIIRNQIIDTIIRIFQEKSRISICSYERPFRPDVFNNKKTVIECPPSKAGIANFSSCYDYFFELMNISRLKGYEENSIFHSFGCSLLDWLLTGEWNIKNEEIINFISKCSDENLNDSWLNNRWKTIQLYEEGHIEEALSEEVKALEIARKSNESAWIINDILIDCRNLEISISNERPEFSNKNKYQDELNQQKTDVYLPLLDRCLDNIYRMIEEDDFRNETTSPNTALLDSNFSSILIELANYLFVAAFYGSNTHFHMTRRTFAYVLCKYAKILKNPTLAFNALKQYVLIGRKNDFKSYLESSWDDQYSLIASHADEIWKSADYIPIEHRHNMKLSIFTSLGLYFSNTVFEQVQEYIYSFSKCLTWYDSETYFEAILANLIRLDPEKTIQIVTSIIEEGRFNLCYKLSHIILCLKLEQICDQKLLKLSDTLKTKLPLIISRNGDPQMIAALVKRSRNIFGYLENIDGNGLSGYQQSLYRINTGSAEWRTILKDRTDSIYNYIGNDNNNGSYDILLDDYFYIIRVAVREYGESLEMVETVIHDIVPLIINVLISKTNILMKEHCVTCLCEVLSFIRKKGIKTPASIKRVLQNEDIDGGSDFFLYSRKKTFKIKLLMAKIIAGIDKKQGLFQCCIEFGKLEIEEKIAMIVCIEKYLYYKRDCLYDIDPIVVSIILMCHSEMHADIRKIAVYCLAYIVKSQYHDVATAELKKAVFDPSDKVRYALLSICKNNKLPDDISNPLIPLFCNDANYKIRNWALRK